MKQARSAKPVLPFAIAAVAGFALAWILVVALVIPEEGAPPDVVVPGVVGLTQADAQRKLVSAGLVASVGEERFSPDAPRSTVLAQLPSAGEPVARGTTITLDISAGQQRVTIPALEGATRGDAVRALSAAGLQVGDVSELADEAPRGEVLTSSPEPGEGVPMGTRVDLVVSAGPRELTMPDLVGRDQATAMTLVRQLGLALEPVTRDEESSFPIGTVVAQSPAAGSSVAPGSSITIRVSGRP